MTSPISRTLETSNMSFIKQYDYWFRELADERVENWTLSSPASLVTIIALYVLIIFRWAPRYMENRKPFDLKKIIAFYNLFQVLACVLLIYGILTSGWLTTYSMGCQPGDFSRTAESIRMVTMMWYTVALKGIELIETVFFILRKKHNQVSFLHVYHHISTFSLAWIGLKYLGGGMITFAVMLNCGVHVLMYTYYLLSLAGPKMQQRLQWWKKNLTVVQMVQFCIILIHSLSALRSTCNVPRKLLIIYFPNIGFIFYMFYDFYKKSYTKQIANNKKNIKSN